MRHLSAAAVFAIVSLLSGLALAEPPSDRVSQGDLVVGAGERVGDAVVMSGTLTVLGWVTGDAVALGGDVHLMPGARVDGDITALGGSIIVEPGAVTYGSRTGIESGGGAVEVERGQPRPQEAPRLQADETGHGPSSFVKRWVDGLGSLAQRVGHMLALYGLLVVLGLIMLGVAPLRTRALAAAVAAHPGKSLGLGLLVILGAIVGLVVLTVTIVGIPFAAVLVAALSCAAVLGLTGVAILIGELLPIPRLRDRSALKLLLGAGLLVLALAIPYAGGVVGVVATVLGLGSLAITRLRPGHAVFFNHGRGSSAQGF